MRGDEGVLQRFPADLQKEALLRVHARGFAWRNAEEVRIKQIHVIEETAPTRSDFSWSGCTRSIELIHIPAIKWDFADGIHPTAQHIPKGTRAGSFREAAA